MKRGRFLSALAMLCPLLATGTLRAGNSSPTVITWPAPAGVAENTDFTVRVRTPGGEWQEVAEYLVKVDVVRDIQHVVQESSYASFDFSGAVEVAVTSNRGPIHSARIRPLSYGIRHEVAGNTVRFSLDQPRNLSVEVNGDIFRNLHLSANAVEESPPSPADPDVIYFGPGLHILDYPVPPPATPPSATVTSPGSPIDPARRESFRQAQRRTLRVPSGKTVYLAPGAVVRGRILFDQVENARLLGRGMVEQGPRGGGVRIANSRRIVVEGIFTPQCFTGGSQEVAIRNVKCISYLPNGDGMNVISSRDVLIDGVFNRNSDDCVTVYGTRLGFAGGASRITVQNSVLWADVAHPILVGTHGSTPRPEVLEDLTFRNLDILDHCEAQIDYQGCLSLNAGDSNLVRNVRFEDIRIEDFRRGQLVNLRVFFNRKYSTSPGRGIENVLFRNITYNGTQAEQSILAGYDDQRGVRDIVFENLVINGRAINDATPKPEWFKTSDLAGIFVGEHVHGVVFRAAP